MNYIFVHGLESSGEGFKGKFFQKKIPSCLTPTFKAFDPSMSNKLLLNQRMSQLKKILNDEEKWVIIGSSFGGLMASIYSIKNNKRVKKLVLLAPLLATRELDPSNFEKFEQFPNPVIIFHGKNDNVIPIGPTRKRAEELFQELSYIIVDDDHHLHRTVQSLDWIELIKLD
jgi:predicted esterase